MQIEHHADREEEQPEQDGAERLDIGLQLVPIGRIGQHHAGDKRAQRGGQPQRLHHGRAGDHGEQPGEDEHLALAQAADQPEQRPEQEPPRDDQPDHRAGRVEPEQPARRRVRIRRRAAKRGDHRDQRHDRQVLEQQDRERPLAERRPQPSRGLQHRQHLRGRRQRQRQPERERSRRAEPGEHHDHAGDRQPARHHLREAEAEDVFLQLPQPRRAQLEPDEEQKQRDAEFGEPHLGLGSADQTEDLRSGDRARDEIAQRRAEPQPPEQENEYQREPEQHHAIAQQRSEPVAMHQSVAPAACGTRVATASAAASAAASNASRIDGCRAV